MKTLEGAIQAADHLAKQTEFPLRGLPWLTQEVCTELACAFEAGWTHIVGSFYLIQIGAARPTPVGKLYPYPEARVIVWAGLIGDGQWLVRRLGREWLSEREAAA